MSGAARPGEKRNKGKKRTNKVVATIAEDEDEDAEGVLEAGGVNALTAGVENAAGDLGGLDELPGIDASGAREDAVKLAAKKRQAKKNKRAAPSLDPADLRTAAGVFFRPAREGEKDTHVYCKARDYEGQVCKDGKVAVTELNGTKSIRSDYLVSHLNHCHAEWWRIVKLQSADGYSAEDAFQTLCKAATPAQVQKKLNFGVEKKAELVEKQLALLMALIESNTPFGFMDKPLWQVFLSTCGLDLQSGKTIQRLLRPLYLVALADGVNAIKQAGVYSVGFDYWTALGGTHYLGVTYHYTDDNLNVHSRLLDLIECTGAATAELSLGMIEERIATHFDRDN